MAWGLDKVFGGRGIRSASRSRVIRCGLFDLRGWACGSKVRPLSTAVCSGAKAPGFLLGGAKHLLTVSNNFDAMICGFPTLRKLRESMDRAPAAPYIISI